MVSAFNLHKCYHPIEFISYFNKHCVFVVVVQSLLCLFVIPWAAAHQASLFFTTSQSLLKLMPIEWVMPLNHLILCHPLLLPPSILPNIRVFSNEKTFA